MVSLIQLPELQLIDANGNPIVAAAIHTYIPTTTTPKTTWSNSGGTVANANPVITDAAGRCIIYGNGSYRLLINDAAGNLVYDQVTGTGTGATTFATIAALRAGSGSAGQLAYVLGYTAAGDGGQGTFYAAASSDADNGGTIIVDAAGTRWYRDADQGEWNVQWFGAKVDGATDDTSAIQACITAAIAVGANVYIPPGNTLISGAGLSIDHSALTSDTALVRTSLRGGGPGVTRLSYSGTGTCLTYTGHSGGGNGGVSGYFTIADMRIMGPGSTAAGGLTINLAAWFILRNIIIEQFHYSFVGYDVLSFLAEACQFKFSDYGAVVQYNTFSNPNAITFLNCEFSNNANFGLTAGNADDINLIGCGIQGNGLTGSDTDRYGVLITNNNTGQFEEGANGGNFVGCYFELNALQADLWLAAGAEESATFNVRDCTFNRASATAGQFTANNVRLDVTSSLTARVSLTVQGSAFKGYTPYVVSSARPYIAVNATSNNYTFVQLGNFFYHPTEYPVVAGPVVCAKAMATAWAFFDGTTAGTNAPTAGLNVTSLTRLAAGSYRINFEKSFNTAINFVVTGTVNGAGVVILGVQGPGAGAYIDIATINTTTGANADFTAVSFAIYGNGYI
jgi:hypothetical protein